MGESKSIYRKNLGKVCFQHCMVYGDFKDLPRKMVFGKVLRLSVKAFEISSNPKYD